MTERSGGRGRMRVGAAILAATALASPLGCATTQEEPAAVVEDPPRLTPIPDEAAAAAMESVQASTDLTLDACALLDLSPKRIAALTGTDIGDTETPVAGHARNICTYGGPGAELTTGATTTPTSSGIGVSPTSTVPGAPPTSAGGPGTARRTAAPGDPADPSDGLLDTVTVAVVEPGGAVAAALADLPGQLAPTYVCSEIRGTGADATTVAADRDEGAPSAAGPPPVDPELATSYLDCVTSPTGGGTEAHTVLVAGGRIWHLVATRPNTPRGAETEARTLSGLHRLAIHILG